MVQPEQIKVLVACEFSGVVASAFDREGFDTWSCDFKPSTYHKHLQDDVRYYLNYPWNLLIAHPPGKHLSISGARWFEEKREEQQEALDFVRELLAFPVPHSCIENPVSMISTYIRQPDQCIQPYNYGHDASKKTCLWLKNLPRLWSSGPYVPPRFVDGLPRWGNQTDSGQNKLGETKDREDVRATSYDGIATAMARQWGPFLMDQFNGEWW